MLAGSQRIISLRNVPLVVDSDQAAEQAANDVTQTTPTHDRSNSRRQLQQSRVTQVLDDGDDTILIESDPNLNRHSVKVISAKDNASVSYETGTADGAQDQSDLDFDRKSLDFYE